MEENSSWTPSPEVNKLGLTDKNVNNEYEAKGIAAAVGSNSQILPPAAANCLLK